MLLIKKFFVPLISATALSVLAVNVNAEDSDKPSAWRPPAELLNHYDWIRLDSDEWLKGELLSYYNDELEFDSDELGVLVFDWDDVVEVITHDKKTLRLIDGSIMLARLHVNDGMASIVTDDDEKILKVKADKIKAERAKEKKAKAEHLALAEQALAEKLAAEKAKKDQQAEATESEVVSEAPQPVKPKKGKAAVAPQKKTVAKAEAKQEVELEELIVPTQPVKRFELMSIAADNSSERNFWSGDVTFGLDIRNGNTSESEYSLGIVVMRRTAITRLMTNYQGYITKSDGIETENNHRFTNSFDWLLSQNFFWRVIGLDFFRDTFQNIDSRWSVTSEGGYRIYDTSEFYWDFTGGPGYQSTNFESVGQGKPSKESSGIVKLGTDLKWEINGDVDYVFQYNVQLLSEEAGKAIHHLESTIKIDLFKDFDLKFSYILDRIAEPLADELGQVPERDDSRLVIGVEYEF